VHRLTLAVLWQVEITSWTYVRALKFDLLHLASALASIFCGAVVVGAVVVNGWLGNSDSEILRLP
jgi:hypothetical protein